VSEELKPCPFCGKRPIFGITHRDIDSFWWVQCLGCTARITGYEHEDDASAVWNTRPGETQAAGAERTRILGELEGTLSNIRRASPTQDFPPYRGGIERAISIIKATSEELEQN
jgi:Lar family restriction alleviation protein